METSMSNAALPYPSRTLLAPLAATLLMLASPTFAADDPGAKDAPQGAAVTVLKASKFCFPNLVEAFGILIPREETMVRPDRPGLKVTDILADPGETVAAGQNLARLALPEGGTTVVSSPVAGTILSSTATIGAPASPRGEALFTLIARSEFDLVGMVPTQDLPKLAVNQPARIRLIGAGEVEGKVRRVAPTVEPNSQLGQVFVGITTNRKLLVNSVRPRHHQDRPELRRVGAAHRRALWLRRDGGAGGAARADRNQAGGGRADRRRPDRNPRGTDRG